MEELNIEAPTLSSAEIQTCISEIWVLSQAIEAVPVRRELIRKECHHIVRQDSNEGPIQQSSSAIESTRK